MSHTTLVSTSTLARQYKNPEWVVFDCRFSLTDTQAGEKAYRQGHIPNARYVHLDKDLSSAITSFTGRHPLPDFKILAKKLGDWGVNNRTQVVVYDDMGNAFSSRLWWLLRCLGHNNVAVLNGGLNLWKKHGGKMTTKLPKVTSNTFRGYLDDGLYLSAEQLEKALAKKSIKLIDARAVERYKGEQEPIDAVAGHVPYALNRPFQLNLDAEGKFLPNRELEQQFKQLIANVEPENVVHMCGSGVTACHNLLAMEIAHLSGSKLYTGSWSEWIRNKNRSIAKNL
ncbi:MAG: sulfurtransferase [Methylococcaceae bacterium]|nr:sulfurtransferase [Methylococcaceae bacterium]